MSVAAVSFMLIFTDLSIQQ